MRSLIVVVLVIASAGIAIADDDTKALAEAIKELNHTTDKKGSGWWQYALGFLSTIITTAVTFFATRWWNKRNMPVLTGVVESDKGSVYETPYMEAVSYIGPTRDGIKVIKGEKEGESKYLRLKAVNTGKETAKKCRAILSRVTKKEGDNWVDLGYHDTGLLQWSHFIDTEQDIVKDIPYYVAICSTPKASLQLKLCLQAAPLKYEKILNNKGIYRLYILLTAENAKAVIVCVRVTWHCDYETLSIEMDAEKEK